MLSFKCKRCGACCRQAGFVYLKEDEAVQLAAFLGIDVYAFTETHCLLLDRQHLVLKKDPDEACLFLVREGCKVYDARPAQCRDFPLKWKTEKSLGYCEGMRKD